MHKRPAPSRPVNLFRKPTDKRAPVVFDRLDRLQAEIELQEQRGQRHSASAGRFRQCLRALCLDLYVAHLADPDLEIGVQRDNSGLTLNPRYPDFVSARPFRDALNGLIATGYAEQISVGTQSSGMSTRIKATSKLRDCLSMSKVTVKDIIDMTDPIRLKVGKKRQAKKLTRFEDDENTIRWRKNLSTINANNARYVLRLDVGSSDRRAMEAERWANAEFEARSNYEPFAYERVDLTKTDLHRVFNSADWSKGGRFYGVWWQSVPPLYRQHITINGKPTCEHDYSAIHLRLLYALVGTPVPNHADPYSEPYGLAHKDVVKKAFNVMLNSEGPPDPKTVQKFSPARLGMTWRQFLEGIEKHHLPIARYFNSGEGVRLQRLDADIAEHVMLMFAGMQYPCLPIHDSFITFASLSDELPKLMEQAAQEIVGKQLPTKVNFIAQYNGPTGEVTNDIGTILSKIGAGKTPYRY